VGDDRGPEIAAVQHNILWRRFRPLDRKRRRCRWSFLQV